MKILVTGGSGFIGTNLVSELINRGHEVVVTDLNHSKKENFIRADVSSFRQLSNIFKKEDSFDAVYHLAAEYGRWNGEAYYENLWKTNVIGTKHLIRLQEELKFKMIFFSSAEVYGDYNENMDEDVMMVQPISKTYQMNDYAISKWAGELMILNSERTFNTKTVRVRPVNCYGPHEEFHEYRGFIPKFIYKILNEEKITVFSGHNRIIDYVEDSCRTWANILDNFISGEVYNVGGRIEWQHNIEWYANKIIELTGKNSDLIDVVDTEKDTTLKKSMNFSKAVRDLNHNPKIDPEEGIKRTISWMKSNYNL